ncbi:hypothetical protein COB52_02680 [Candidatus Kaiserbacteria bacterium]|nr:MAG: hypothetical protein COB52_02680 [Candidatus Kaiserbacteria bacterium]
MVRRKKERDEVWWIAHGHSSHSRQPSFAPSTARPVVTVSSYGFGWNRKKACFVTTRSHGMLERVNIEDHPCDSGVALGILRRCAYKNVLDRFFDNPYAKDDDADIFSASGYMFGISLSKRYWSNDHKRNAEASLHFYAPDGTRQSINFHNGMTGSFGRSISGLEVSGIKERMQ